MKKLATILMLVVSLLAGSAPVEAKTTKKGKANSSHRSSSRTSVKPSSGLTIDIFLQPFNESSESIGDWGITQSQANRVMLPKDSYEVFPLLEDIGFQEIYYTFREEWDDSINEKVVCPYSLHVKDTPTGQIIVRMDCGMYEIEFPTSAEKEKFLKTAEAKGYRYNRSSENYVIPGTEDIYWIATYIYVNGNKVRFSAGGE